MKVREPRLGHAREGAILSLGKDRQSAIPTLRSTGDGWREESTALLPRPPCWMDWFSSKAWGEEEQRVSTGSIICQRSRNGRVWPESMQKLHYLCHVHILITIETKVVFRNSYILSMVWVGWSAILQAYLENVIPEWVNTEKVWGISTKLSKCRTKRFGCIANTSLTF